MPDASSLPDPPAAPEPSPSRSGFGGLVLLLLPVLVGVALRVGYAQHPDMLVGEWEADGFLTTWEGRPWGALSRVRAPGLPLVLTQVGKNLPVDGRLDVRWLSIGLSLIGLFAACLCAGSLATISGLKRRSMVHASAWIAALWAVHPTLLMSSVSPTPEVLAGTTACLLLAAFGFARHAPGVLSWMTCTVAAGAFIVVGGVLAAAAVVAGVVVYLMPVPRAGRALAVLGGLAVALSLGWFAQRGPDAERPWMPDTAWAYSVRAMLEAPGPHPNTIPTHADMRASQTLTIMSDAVTAAGPGQVGRAWLSRLVFQLLGAGRMEPLATTLSLPTGSDSGPTDRADGGSEAKTLGLGLFDLFLRGGVLLFALTVVGLVRRGAAPSCWPRAGVIVGVLAWLMFLAAGAIGPVAVAPFDLALLGVAGAGVVAADPRKVWTRRLAFSVGGVLLGTFLWTAGWRNEPQETWLTDVDHYAGEGQFLVDLLDDGGPTTGEGHFRAANFMSLSKTPLLRLPEPAQQHASEAWKALVVTPRGDEAVELLVTTLVECQRYADAARLAEDFHSSLGTDDKRSLLLLHWVQDEQRKAENLPTRRP